MRPNLIPYSFITKNMRKQYHRKRAERTWQQWLGDYQNVLVFVLGVAFVLLILYLKHQDKMRQVHNTQMQQQVLAPTDVIQQPGISYSFSL